MLAAPRMFRNLARVRTDCEHRHVVMGVFRKGENVVPPIILTGMSGRSKHAVHKRDCAKRTSEE